MHPDDPFAAPSSTIADPSGSSGMVSPGVVETLRRTKGWVRFLAVLGFAGAGLMVLAAVAMAVMGAAGGTMGDGELPAAFFVGYAFFLVLMAFLYVVPSLRLLRYASGIARLEVQRDAGMLENALEQQRAFWRFVGIAAIVVLVVYALFLVAAIAAGALAALRGGA